MSARSAVNYLWNYPQLRQSGFVPRPLTVTYYVTERCNLNCVYCEDFGAKRNPGARHAELQVARRVLGVIRSVTDQITLTGGEPILHPDIQTIVEFAAQSAKFKSITLLTNGSLLRQHEPLLPYLDHVMISLDDVNPASWQHMIDAPLQVAETILENIIWLAARQQQFGLTLTCNVVITPQSIQRIPDLLDFITIHDLSVSFSPQAVHNWPAYDLLVSEAYVDLLHQIKQRKHQGLKIVGSMAYLQHLIDFTPYQCFPTLAPRVYPNGDLLYPCKPLKDENNFQGGVTNLLEHESWDAAIKTLFTECGEPPRACTSCYQQCYAESSLMQAKPIQYLIEKIRYSTSRKIPLTGYTPG